MNQCKILTWNIWCHYLVKAPKRQSRLEKIVEYLKEQSYDIICIQELFTLKIFGLFTKSNEIEWFIDALKDLGYKYHTNPNDTIPLFFGQNSGLLILSKKPIKESNSGIFTNASITEYSNNKGFVCSTIEINEGVEICICTAHLDAHSNVKLAQVKQIQESLQKYYEEGKPIIVVGDFNICPRAMSNLYQILSDEFSKIGLVDIVNQNQRTHYYGATLDHFFISKELIKADDIKGDLIKDDELGMLSDHYALGTTIYINN